MKTMISMNDDVIYTYLKAKIQWRLKNVLQQAVVRVKLIKICKIWIRLFGVDYLLILSRGCNDAGNVNVLVYALYQMQALVYVGVITETAHLLP